MRTSPDADARSLQHKPDSRSALIRQTIFVLALLVAGLVISLVVVRYIDPPKSGAVLPEHPALKSYGALPV